MWLQVRVRWLLIGGAVRVSVAASGGGVLQKGDGGSLGSVVRPTAYGVLEECLEAIERFVRARTATQHAVSVLPDRVLSLPHKMLYPDAT